MSEVLKNVGGTNLSLQVSCYGDIPAGTDFKVKNTLPFHIKNISGEPVSVTIVGEGGCEMTTIIDEGWNPEIVYMIKNAPEGLQWGY